MRIAFFSNFLNHHQLPFCKELNESEGVEFCFVACEKISEERLNMGYEDMNIAYPFVVRAYEQREEAVRIARECDVAIFGAADAELFKIRMSEKKLTFRFCERLFKKGTWRRFIPRTRKTVKNGYVVYRDSLHILCASAYTASDFALCGFPKEKCFKWGYFPKKQDEPVGYERETSGETVEILYAGRLLRLKRVMDTVRAVHRLVKEGITNLHFTVIGDGEEKERLVKYVEKNKLEEYVEFLPFMSPDEVRAYMNKSDIYVFGSDFREGWGAVVNEAMCSGCAMLVSHAVGSAAYLIEHGKNGYVYECGNIKKLADGLRALIKNPEMRRSFGERARETINEVWCAEEAAARLLMLCSAILEGRDATDIFDCGPCSPAQIVKNDWIRKI